MKALKESLMKFSIQLFLNVHVLIYRLTSGKVMGAFGANTILLLDMVGRKTGKKRTTPLMYFRDGNNYVISASAGGADANPAWYYNLKSNPETTIQVKGDKIKVIAQEASPDKRKKLWTQLTSLAPQFKQYEKKTKRTIPMFILRPVE